MEESPEEQVQLHHDLNVEIFADRYEIWFSDRLSLDHTDLVDECADWLEDQIGVVNLGQIDHQVLMADGVLSDGLRNGLVAWWAERVEDLSHG
jgi:hypothetical protein